MKARQLLFVSMALLASGAQAGPKRLTTYADLVREIDSGMSINVVLNYGRMKLIVDGKEEPDSPKAIGGMKLNVWERFEKGVIRNDRAFLSASQSVLIARPGKAGGYVYNYAKVRIYEDGDVELTARYIKPDTLETVMDEMFKGRLSNGKDTNGVSLFAVN